MTTNTTTGGEPEHSNPNTTPQADSDIPQAASSAADFVSEVYKGHDGDIPYVLNGEIVLSGEPEFIMQHEGALRACAGDQDQSYFLFGVQKDSGRDDWMDCKLTPTATLWKDGTSIFCWALDAPAKADDLKVIALAAVFGMETIDEAIPLPGTDGWESVHAGPSVLYTKDALAETYLPIEPEPFPNKAGPKTVFGPGDKYNDATIITRYDMAAFMGQKITISLGANKDSKKWKRNEISVVGLIHNYFTKNPLGQKDGAGMVFGDMEDGDRLKNKVVACTAIPFDYDTGVTTKSAVAALTKANVTGIIYTSYNNQNTLTLIKVSELERIGGKDCVIDAPLARRYLAEKKNWETRVVETVEIDDHDTFKHEVWVRHDPITKLRLVIFLREPFVMRNEGDTQEEAWANWKRVIEATADMLGLPNFDPACVNPHHFFYLPRHGKDRPFEMYVSGGDGLFDYKTLNYKAAGSDPFATLDKEFGKKSGNNSATDGGKKLGKWSVHRARGFDIENVIEDQDSAKLRGGATSGKTIVCPFDAGHTNAGDSADTGCYTVNASMGASFIIRCRHGSCQNYTNLDMLGKMIEDEWFPESVLWDEQYNSVELTEEEASLGRPKAAPEAEILPTLTELKERIALLVKDAVLDDWSRADWFPILVSIEEAGLNATEKAKAHKALIAHCGFERKTYDAEIAALKQEKKKQDKEAKKQGPKGLDEKTLAKSDKLAALLKASFGTTFHTPTSQRGNDLHLDLIDNRPWFVSGAESAPICTPFVFDGAVVYADRNHDRALRVRVFDADNKVVPVEFDAALLGHLSGNELIGKLYAKGWAGDGPGRDFVLTHLRTKQLPALPSITSRVTVTACSCWLRATFSCRKIPRVPKSNFMLTHCSRGKSEMAPLKNGRRLRRWYSLMRMLGTFSLARC